MSAKSRTATAALLIAAVIAAVVWVTVWGTRAGSTPEPTGSGTTGPAETADAADGGAARIAELYESELSDVQVQGSGRVVRLLSDDVEGDRHQRFILELEGGMTLLVAHNIDDFPRLDGLAVGDEVAFNGEYEWGELGGTIHWTHRDNHGDHVDGWLEWHGKRYW